MAETNRECIPFSAIVIATGLSRRQLDLASLSQGWGTWAHDTAGGRWNYFAHKTVVIVGAGDGAFENAIQMANHGSRVHLLCRSRSPRASAHFIEQALASPLIVIHPLTEIVEIEGGEQLNGVTAKTPENELSIEEILKIIHISEY